MNLRKPKVLLAHNRYLEKGGEDQSFEAERILLSQHGHQLCIYTRSNEEIKSYNFMQFLSLPMRTISAWDSRQSLRTLMLAERPALAHFNNTFPLISPSAYDACRELNVPVLQNLRNYRLLCANALFFRDHHVCEDCLGRFFPWPAILHACYRDSHVQSTVVAMMLAYHHLRNTWNTRVDVFIALTEFSRRKFVEGGLPAEKIVVRPNFVYDPGISEEEGNYVLFVGRLDESKGLFNLLNAWKECRSIALKIAGEGSLLPSIRSFITENGLQNIELCGQLSASDVIALIKSARFIVFPSVWYEAFPRVILESFSCGRAVVASNIGSSSEIIDDGRTGLLFRSSDPRDLSETVNYLWHSPSLSQKLGREARREYELRYTPEVAYRSLTQIYDGALTSRK